MPASLIFEATYFLKNSISSQPCGREIAEAKLVDDIVSNRHPTGHQYEQDVDHQGNNGRGALRYAVRLPQICLHISVLRYIVVFNTGVLEIQIVTQISCDGTE